MMSKSHSNTDSDSVRLGGLRIARISTVPFYVVAQLKQQIVFLSRQGAKVTIVASDAPEFADFAGIPNVGCHVIDIPRSISPWQDLLACFRLWKFFRAARIQIAHSTTPKAGLLTAVAAMLAGVPVRLHTFTGQPWVTMRGVKRWLARSSDKLIGTLNTRCYTDSPSQRLFLIKEGVVDADSLFVIGLGSLAGVDIARFDQSRFGPQACLNLESELSIPASAPVLLFVGRITDDKGVRELLLAFQNARVKAHNAHLLIVGHFDEESGVANALKRKDVEGIANVHLVDYTPIPEAYMAIADILCLPSYREGFGTVVIEAAAMGLPTVGTEIYGLTDAVAHGETGLLVPPRDADALARALEQLLADTALRERMGQAARQRVLEHFDSNQFSLKIMREYQLLIKEAGITPAHD
jgi:glycosyltransferase involved in cell wall biosynthesis